MSTYCPAHAERHGWHRKDPGVPDARGWAWTQLRARALDRDGHACVQCGRPATEVDHIVPRSVDPTRASDLDNLRSLCKPCHRDVTNRQRRRQGEA